MKKRNIVLLSVAMTFAIVVGVMLFFAFFPETKYPESFVIDEPNKQKVFVKRLEDEGLEFVIDQDGQLWFKTKDRDRVRSIAFEVMRGEQ